MTDSTWDKQIAALRQIIIDHANSINGHVWPPMKETRDIGALLDMLKEFGPQWLWDKANEDEEAINDSND